MSPKAQGLARASKHPEATSTAASTATPAEEQSTGDSIVDIDPKGDVVLYISHETASTAHLNRFRVNSSPLKTSSKYFASLLQGRFGESEQVEKRHVELRKQYGNFGDVPAAELPVIQIRDVGRISAVKSIEALCTDFLSILHDKETPPAPPVVNVANLAIVADRFDALDAVRGYVRRKKMLRAIDGKTTAKAEIALSEEKVRQRLLVAILLEYPHWTEKYSARMILRGWVDREVDETSALWWDLPARVEDELAHRRNCILGTIQSLEHHFLRQYTSRTRQCRFGYDSSAQCDSFQLGEMVRFFSRIGTIQLRGTIMDEEEPPGAFAGDVHTLLDTLRQVPEYQIDTNHHHCGIRTSLVAILDTINECLLHIGICQECWIGSRNEQSWMDAKRPMLWKRQLLRLRTSGHHELHTNVRAVFTAVERDWGA
jgi:hypothetical protein